MAPDPLNPNPAAKSSTAPNNTTPSTATPIDLTTDNLARSIVATNIMTSNTVAPRTAALLPMHPNSMLPNNIAPNTMARRALAPHAMGVRNTSNNQYPSQDTLELRRLHRGRMQVCRKSPFLHANFNLAEHKNAMQGAKERRDFRKLSYSMQVIERRQAEQNRTFPLPGPEIRPAFDGKEFSTNHSAVLLEPTVFVPTYQKTNPNYGQPISDWPSRSEMKYEGDDRISTDVLHSRFPPAPRVVGNGTVNWQQRTIIMPQPLDWFYPSTHELDIAVRSNAIPGREFTDEEGQVALGRELMGMLECEDVYL